MDEPKNEMVSMFNIHAPVNQSNKIHCHGITLILKLVRFGISKWFFITFASKFFVSVRENYIQNKSFETELFPKRYF